MLGRWLFAGGQVPDDADLLLAFESLQICVLLVIEHVLYVRHVFVVGVANPIKILLEGGRLHNRVVLELVYTLVHQQVDAYHLVDVGDTEPADGAEDLEEDAAEEGGPEHEDCASEHLDFKLLYAAYV